MRRELPTARIRAELTVPLRLAGVATVGRVFTFDDLVDGHEHLAIGLGRYAAAVHEVLPAAEAPLVRLHSECLTGDVLGSERCDCGPQLHEAVERITAEGGYLLYLRQEGRGIGLYEKLDAYTLQDSGLDTYEANLALGHHADERDYTAAAQMLHMLGVDRLRLLSNNPDKADQLAGAGLDVAERVPTRVHVTRANVAYLSAKERVGDHTLDVAAARAADQGR
jgi:GTP cyclohydrolase II